MQNCFYVPFTPDYFWQRFSVTTHSVVAVQRSNRKPGAVTWHGSQKQVGLFHVRLLEVFLSHMFQAFSKLLPGAIMPSESNFRDSSHILRLDTRNVKFVRFGRLGTSFIKRGRSRRDSSSANVFQRELSRPSTVNSLSSIANNLPGRDKKRCRGITPDIVAH